MIPAYLSLGSNLGNKTRFLNDAITQLSCHPDIALTKISPFYKTDPVGVVTQDWFLNAVIEIHTDLSPATLLDVCQSVETKLMRERTQRWGPRTLDIDILLYADISMDTETLTIPHPRMFERAFVLIPLQAIAPHIIIAGKSIAAYTEAVSGQNVEILARTQSHFQPNTKYTKEQKLDPTVCVETLDTVWQGADLLTCFRDYPYRSLLDSTMRVPQLGRYTIFCCNPYHIFKSKGKQCSVYQDNAWTTTYQESPLNYFESLMAPYHLCNMTQLPFIGGAVGYIAYDLCHELEDLPRKALDDRHLPDIHFCTYDGAIVVDHLTRQTHIVGAGVWHDAKQFVHATLHQLTKFALQASAAPPQPNPTKPEPRTLNIEHSTSNAYQYLSGFSNKGTNYRRNPWQSNMTKEAYMAKVATIKDYIAAGDIYQVNLAQRFATTTQHSPEILYARLSQVNPAPYAAFIETDAGTLLSSSPECFLKVTGHTIMTRPIKGTRPRLPNSQADAAQKDNLLHCEKERAELLMIVDLERNDLGRICEPGSVQVKDLYHIESYSTVHHLVGEVHGHLNPNTAIEQILRATFPGGSITGAPKIRAMEIIDELEPHQRGAFTGAMGFIGFDRGIHLNIAIRTILMQEAQAFFQVGAGIVWDSDPAREYEETLHKAKALFTTLNIEACD